MICPKCGFEQPESPECARCGIIVSRYKGPVLGGAPAQAEPPSPPPPLSLPPTLPLTESTGAVFGGPSPAPAPAAVLAMAGGGTLYEGPVPAVAGGGTVYGGPGSAPAAPLAMGRVQENLGVGRVMSETFSIYFSNFIPFALLTIIALSPIYLLQAYAVASDGDLQKVLESVAKLLSSLCQQVATAAITFGVFQEIRGRSASIGDCLGRGFSSMGAVLFLAIVQGLGITLGIIACIVPGILLALRWAVSVPAAVEERPGISQALERSTYLTEGYRGEILRIYFLLWVILIGLATIVAMAAGDNETLQLVLMGIVNLLITGLFATVASVMYYRLRSIKESIDVDQISSVFA